MKIKRLLVVLALLGLFTATVLILLPISPLQQIRGPLTVSSETRTAVEASLTRLMPAGSSSAQDTKLQEAVRQLASEPYVASAWLVDENGIVVVHEGGPGKVGDGIPALGQDMAAALAGLPENTLDSAQYMQLLAIGAVRSEGEHNDVFNHLVRPLYRPDGTLGAMVVVAYDINPQIGNPAVSQILFVLLAVLGLGLYWLCLPAWVWIDARQRGEPAVLWALFVIVTNLVGLIAYLIAVRGKPAV